MRLRPRALFRLVGFFRDWLYSSRMNRRNLLGGGGSGRSGGADVALFLSLCGGFQSFDPFGRVEEVDRTQNQFISLTNAPEVFGKLLGFIPADQARIALT